MRVFVWRWDIQLSNRASSHINALNTPERIGHNSIWVLDSNEMNLHVHHVSDIITRTLNDGYSILHWNSCNYVSYTVRSKMLAASMTAPEPFMYRSASFYILFKLYVICFIYFYILLCENLTNTLLDVLLSVLKVISFHTQQKYVLA